MYAYHIGGAAANSHLVGCRDSDQPSFFNWLMTGKSQLVPAREMRKLIAAVARDPAFAGRDPENGYHYVLSYMRRAGYPESYVTIAGTAFADFLLGTVMNDLFANYDAN